MGLISLPQVQSVSDVSQAQRLTFRTATEYPSGVSLRVRGQLKGVASITTVEDRWEPHQVSGDVDWQVYHDWFYPTCTFEYSPSNVTAGHLSFELTFH